MTVKYKKNLYQCEQCENKIVTIARDFGFTPFMISCETQSCEGNMYSSNILSNKISAFYDIYQSLIPTHEWYRPDESVSLSKDEREYVSKGGLMLRMISNENGERIYPCTDCGKLRSVSEGGKIFSVCDDCWQKHYNQMKDKRT